MKRRTLIRAIPLGLAGATFSLSFPSLMAAIAGENHGEWGYEDPTNWGSLSPEYQACQLGQQQSPIDLKSSLKSELKPLEISYHDIPLRVVHNGHTIQVNSDPGNEIILDQEKFALLQFHFHHPSEHTVKGKNYPMEIHFVHKNSQGLLTVFAVFLTEGEENPILKKIWKVMPSRQSSEKSFTDVKISLDPLFPENLSIYRYFGSLTTPPCSEIVNWIVFQEPIEVSPTQIQQFQKIFPLNARPVQPLNHRFLLTSI